MNLDGDYLGIIEINGAGPGLEGYEAGGQILRLALALSPILKKPFRLYNIRSGRPKPGLQPQHLAGVKAVADITGAEVEGAYAGSQEVTVIPSNITGGAYAFDTGTAGSVTLLAQSLLPLLLFANKESRLRLIGGTHVSWSPTADYYQNVFLPLVRKFGADVEFSLNRYGWYPKGGGEIELRIKPSKLNAVELLSRGNLKSIEGCNILSNIKGDVLEREEEGVLEALPNAQISKKSVPARSAGTAVTLWAAYENTILGAEALGKIGKRAEDVGREAANRLSEEMHLNSAVDEHMSDQLLVLMALAKGKSSISVPTLTSHAKTCAWLIPIFTNIPFDITDNVISVKGIG